MSAADATGVPGGPGADPVVGVAELRAALASPTPPLLLDVRWQLIASRPEDPAHPVGYADYLEGHLPGAVFVDLGAELAAAPSAQAGRHPLPSPEAFAEAVRRWGLGDGQEAVVYDDQGGLSAARAWWLLRNSGLPARVLDGGVRAWSAAGEELEQGPVTPRASAHPATAGWGHMPSVDADAAAALGARGDGVLLDARAFERYTGATEPIDPRAGHVPGALSLPTAGNLEEGGRFLDVEALRERFAEAGAVPGAEVAVYCGSGVTASHQILALARAGVEAALYPGSFSQWSSDPGRAVVTGEAPAVDSQL